MKSLIRFTLAALALLAQIESGNAGTGIPSSSPTGMSTMPDFVSNRMEIPSSLLDVKKTGTYWVGFPIIGYDPDVKYSIGAEVNVYTNGSPDDPLFRYNPFQQKVTLGASCSTGGAGLLQAKFQAPNFNNTPWHVYGRVEYFQNDYENYFGMGRESLDALHFPGSSQSYSSYDAYHDALLQSRNGQTYAYYDNYRETRARADMKSLAATRI